MASPVMRGALPAAMRATTFSLVVYEPEETQHLLLWDFTAAPLMVFRTTHGSSAAGSANFGIKRTGKVSSKC